MRDQCASKYCAIGASVIEELANILQSECRIWDEEHYKCILPAPEWAAVCANPRIAYMSAREAGFRRGPDNKWRKKVGNGAGEPHYLDAFGMSRRIQMVLRELDPERLLVLSPHTWEID